MDILDKSIPNIMSRSFPATWLVDPPEFLTPSGIEYTKVPYSSLSDRDINNRLLDNIFETLNDVIVSGSFMAGVLLENKDISNDIDMFFTSENSFKIALQYLLDHQKDEKDNDDNWSLCGYTIQNDINNEDTNWMNTRFIKFTHPKRPPVQLLKLFWYKDMVQVIDSFDFTCIQIATDGKYIVMNPLGILDLRSKKLVLHRVQFGASTIRRIMKYSKKGFYACPGFLQQVAEELKKLTSEDNEIVYID